MKKTLIALLCLVMSNIGFPVLKVQFKLQNPHLESGIWAIDVVAIVQSGQTWRVGSSNLRYDFTTTPPSALTIHADNPAIAPLACIHSNSNYGAMTTTSISGGTAISLNITRLNNCCYLTQGTYTLGRLRFNRIDTTACVTLHMRTTVTGFSVVQDSLTQWFSPADFDSLVSSPAGCIRIDYLTGIEPSANEIPTKYELYQNFPNPFNPVTLIKYDIPKPGLVTITLYDVLGKEIRKLVNENVKPGGYEITWDGKNFASGSYFNKIVSGDFTDIKKMILVK